MQPETSTTSLHPEGWHEGTIVDHGISQTGTGNPQVCLKIESQRDGRTIWAYLPLTEKAVEYTVIKLRNAGFAGGSFADLEDGTALRGNVIEYKVEHETYNGQTRAKVGWIADPNGGMSRSPAAAANARRFDAALRANPPMANPATSGLHTPAAPASDAFGGDETGEVPF